MVKRALILLMMLFSVLSLMAAADAKLKKIGTSTYKGKDYSLIYEEDQSLIWLDCTSPANRWPQQMSWVSGLNAQGTLTYRFDPGITVSWDGDWRLPKAKDGARKLGYDGTSTAGFNIITSEMGYLFYKSLGNLGYYDTDGKPRPGWGLNATWGLKKVGPFTNLKDDMYWSGTEYAIASDHAWDFNMYFGSQGNTAFKGSYSYLGIAVRSGRVISATVP
jgi:hypothetical protein